MLKNIYKIGKTVEKYGLDGVEIFALYSKYIYGLSDLTEVEYLFEKLETHSKFVA